MLASESLREEAEVADIDGKVAVLAGASNVSRHAASSTSRLASRVKSGT
jgi:hypothetical protein